jgi:hypothetical protein
VGLKSVGFRGGGGGAALGGLPPKQPPKHALLLLRCSLLRLLLSLLPLRSCRLSLRSQSNTPIISQIHMMDRRAYCFYRQTIVDSVI